MPITNVAQLERIAVAVRRRRSRTACAASSTRARDDAEAVAELGVAYATLQCAELLAGGAPGHPLLHAQPLAGDARDPQRAEAAAPVGVAARRSTPASDRLVLDGDDLEPLGDGRHPVGPVQRTSTESSWR